MAYSDWADEGKAKGGGASDPNVMRLGDNNRIRLLDAQKASWKQHIIESPDDPNVVRFLTCPQDSTCPLCRKPEGPDPDKPGKTKRYFPIQRRFASNVWDYESGTVKILIGGPQIFDEFLAAAKSGFDPTGSDWIITKLGAGKQTEYKVVRGDSKPLDFTVTADMLHDRDRYERPASVEKIFETLEQLGIDYDALPVLEFTVDQALAFVLPYGRHRGQTVEQVLATDDSWAHWLHDAKLQDGMLGDPVFLALHTAMEDRGMVDGLLMEQPPVAVPPPVVHDAEAPQAPQPSPPGITVKLMDPAGSVVQVPLGAAEALLGAGWTEPAADKAEDVAIQQDLERSLTEGEPVAEPDDPDKPFAAPDGRRFKTQGALTAYLNRNPALKGEAPAEGNGGGAEQDSGEVLERCKALIARQPQMKDYSVLLGIFDDVAGKRNISEFTVDELLKLEARLQESAS